MCVEGIHYRKLSKSWCGVMCLFLSVSFHTVVLMLCFTFLFCLGVCDDADNFALKALGKFFASSDFGVLIYFALSCLFVDYTMLIRSLAFFSVTLVRSVIIVVNKSCHW